MSAILAIAVKDLRLLVRDKASAFFTFLFPLLLAVFFGTVFGGFGDGESSGEVTIAVVDESGGPLAKSFAEELEADEMLATVAAKDRAEGESLVRRGSVLACVILPKDFDESVEGIFSGQGIALEAIVDPARKAEAGLLAGKLNEHAFRQMGKAFGDSTRMRGMLDRARSAIAIAPSMTARDRELFSNLFESVETLSDEGSDATRLGTNSGADGTGGGFEFMPARVTITELPTSRKGGPANAYAISFPQGAAWGLMGCVIAFGASLAHERSRGTLLRLAVAPVTRRQVLAGKALGCFLACVIVIVFLIAFARVALGVRVEAPLMLAVATVASAIGFCGVMMLLAGLCRTEGAAEGAGRAVILVLAMIGGGTIPLFLMPRFLQVASSVSPFKWAILAMEGAIWRGFGWSEMALPVGVLLGFAVVGFAVGGWAFTRAEAR